MKHFVFPTVQQANDFAAELKSEGLVREDTRYHGYGRGETEGFAGRRTGAAYTPEHYERGVYETREYETREHHGSGVDAEEVGEEAVKGTAVGAVTGAAAGLTGAALTGAAAATVATGGLAAPLIGLTLLGSGVGAAVGAAGEAARESGDHDQEYDYDTYEVDETRYGTFDETYKAGGRAIAVDDSVPEGPLMEAAKKHGGRLVS